MPLPASYGERFQAKSDAEFYDREEYGPGSYASRMWELQRPVLAEVLERHRAEVRHPLSLLDFACGTGRVTSFVEPLVETVHGIDISAEMVALARTKCARAVLQVGDILEHAELLRSEYDVVTVFRFLMNVEPEIRRRALCRLRELIRQPDGLLIVNVHGNSCSLRHPAIVWRRYRERLRQTGTMLNEMSPGETRTLLCQCGFQVVRQFGFGILPPTLYRTPLRGLAFAVDKHLAGDGSWNDRAIEMMFLCRPV